MTEQVLFSTEGEFMTNFARKKLYAENDFDGAVKFLMDCMMTDQHTVDERYQRALAILDGTKCLKGTYPYEDYGHYDEENPKHMLGEYFRKQHQRLAKMRLENNDLLYILMCNSDILVYSLHWVLLDNPSKNVIPSPTYDEAYGLTKKQKERLFDFYLATGQEKKVKELYE